MSCAREDKDVYQKETKSVLVQILKRKCSPEASYLFSFLISPRQRKLLPSFFLALVGWYYLVQPIEAIGYQGYPIGAFGYQRFLDGY